MSIWRSPVLYVGLLLIIGVVGGLLAPFVVNWNSYRPELEAYGHRLTGREVRIEGPIAVRLFPWPRLEARDVRVEGPPGFGVDPLIAAKQVKVMLSLGGLFNGTVDVQGIEVLEPALRLVRAADGMTNFSLAPDVSPSASGLLSRVKLDEIKVTGGSLWMEDQGTRHALSVTGIDAVLAAQVIEGPWRVKGKGLVSDLPVNLSFSTASYDRSAPFRFGLTVTPEDGGLPQLVAEGEWSGRDIKGKLRIDPQEAEGQKGSAEGNLKPLALSAEYEADARKAVISKIKIAPARAGEAGTLIEGNGEIAFGEILDSRFRLKAPRVDIDSFAGAGALTRLREGGFQRAIRGVMATLPPRLTTDIAFEATAMTYGGENFKDVRLHAVASPKLIKIEEALGSLPGKGKARFDGTITPDGQTTALQGRLALESGDVRALALWLWPSQAETISTQWKGNRGTLRMQGNVAWSGDSISLKDTDYELDGLPGRANVTLVQGKLPSLALAVEADALDLDAYVPKGMSVANGSAVLAAVGYLPALMDSGKTGEKDVALAVKRLTLNGIVAQDAEVHFLSSLSGFEIKALSIGAVGGANIKGSGLVLSGEDGPSGSLKLDLAAEDATGFLQLAGLDRTGKDALWTGALGRTAAQIELALETVGKEPQIGFESTGSSGILSFKAKGNITDASDMDRAVVSAAGEITAEDSAQMLRLAGLKPVQAGANAGQLAFNLNGTRSKGFDLSLKGTVLDSQLVFDGRSQVGEAYGALDGKLNITTDNASSLAQVFGLSVPEGGAGPARLGLRILPQDGGLALQEIAGQLAGEDFSGSAGFDANGRFSGDFETGPFWLHQALALAFLPWDGRPADLESAFVDPAEAPLQGEIFIRPKSLKTLAALVSDEAVIGIGFDRKSRSFTLKEPGAEGLDIDLTLERDGSASRIAGSLRMTTELGRILNLENGGPVGSGGLVTKGEFKASGFSPASALASIEGKGTYWLEDAALLQLSLPGFDARLQTVKTPDELSTILSSLSAGPGTSIGTRTGSITVVNGEALFQNFSVSAEGATADVDAKVDLTLGNFTGGAHVTLDRDPSLPPVTVTYAGPAGALKVRSATAALASKLGFAMLAKEMAALEDLQKQQQVLIEKEEAQRQADSDRFSAYKAQRSELRNKLRQMRIQTAERERKAAYLANVLAKALKTGNSFNKAELAKRMLELRVHTGPAPALQQPAADAQTPPVVQP